MKILHVFVFLMLVFFTGGCALKQEDPPPSLTPCEEAVRFQSATVDSSRTIGEGAIAGGVIGGAASGIITYLTKGSPKNIVVATAVGATAGAAAGGLYGKSVAEDKAQFKYQLQVVMDKRCELFTCTQELQKINLALEEKISKLRETYGLLKNGEYASGQKLTKELRDKRKEVDNDMKYFAKQQRDAEAKLKELREAASASNDPTMQSFAHSDQTARDLALQIQRNKELRKENNSSH